MEGKGIKNKETAEILTLKETCQLLNCHPNTLRNWDRNNFLKALRFGKRGDRRYKKEDVLDLIEKSREDKVKININKIKNVNNPISIHGIYPYRGKISAIEAEHVIKQLPKKGILLDPFCGSGTIVYEAQKYGLKAIGVDFNPIAVDIARGKVFLTENDNVVEEVKVIIKKAKQNKKSKKMPGAALRHFHKNTAREIMTVANLIGEMSDYIKASFYGSIALTARACNWYKWTSSTVGKDINPKKRVNFYKKFLTKTKKHFFPVLNLTSKIHLYDARNISKIIKPRSIDYIFTSPPYFNCLDYTAYYAKIIYNILGLNRQKIRNNLIQKYKSYKEDMRRVFQELYKVCKKGATVIFVVGDKKIHGNIVNGAEFFSEISPFKENEIIERYYTGTSSQVFDELNKTRRKEQIIIWRK